MKQVNKKFKRAQEFTATHGIKFTTLPKERLGGEDVEARTIISEPKMSIIAIAKGLTERNFKKAYITGAEFFRKKLTLREVKKNA